MTEQERADAIAGIRWVNAKEAGEITGIPWEDISNMRADGYFSAFTVGKIPLYHIPTLLVNVSAIAAMTVDADTMDGEPSKETACPTTPASN